MTFVKTKNTFLSLISPFDVFTQNDQKQINKCYFYKLPKWRMMNYLYIHMCKNCNVFWHLIY